MRLPLRLRLVALIFPLFVPCSLLSQQTASITGEVQVAKTDFPSQPVLVELQLHSATIQSVYTDNQGKYGFYALPANAYHIIIHDDAFYPVDETVKVDPSVT